MNLSHDIGLGAGSIGLARGRGQYWSREGREPYDKAGDVTH